MTWALIAGFTGMLMASAAAAHERWDDRRAAYSRGFENGYRDGRERGRFDSHRGHFDLRNRDYRDADRGYNKHLGPKGEYKKGYRDGFEAGYRETFYRRGRTPWSRPYFPGYPR
jgi:hypothetical protein